MELENPNLDLLNSVQQLLFSALKHYRDCKVQKITYYSLRNELDGSFTIYKPGSNLTFKFFDKEQRCTCDTIIRK